MTETRYGRIVFEGLTRTRNGIEISPGSAGRNFELVTGQGDGSSQSGNITIRTGNNPQSSGRTGNLTLRTGNTSNQVSSSGDVFIFSGESPDTVSGEIVLRTLSSIQNGASGNIIIETDQSNNSSFTSGNIYLRTGQSTVNGSGDIELSTGNSNIPGDIFLNIGLTYGNNPPGNIYINSGSSILYGGDVNINGGNGGTGDYSSYLIVRGSGQNPSGFGIEMRTGYNSVTQFSGNLVIETGQANTTGSMEIITGSGDVTGEIILATGNANQDSGNFSIRTGDSTVNSGNILIETGITATGDSGNISISTGSGQNTGNITIETLDSNQNGVAGDISITCGNSYTGVGGNISIRSGGNSEDQDAGSILIVGGDATSTGNGGDILIRGGSGGDDIGSGAGRGGNISIISGQNFLSNNDGTTGDILIRTENNQSTNQFAGSGTITIQSGSTNFPQYAGNIRLRTHGTSVDLFSTRNGSPTSLRFYDADLPNQSNYIEFSPPSSLSSNQVYTFPQSGPQYDGQCLTTDLSGNLSWSYIGNIFTNNFGSYELFHNLTTTDNIPTDAYVFPNLNNANRTLFVEINGVSRDLSNINGGVSSFVRGRIIYDNSGNPTLSGVVIEYLDAPLGGSIQLVISLGSARIQVIGYSSTLRWFLTTKVRYSS